MRSKKNKHGLSTHIPVDVRRAVRRNSRFGCVVCRCAICEYHHVDPPWADAKTHDPARICFLCGSCHSRVSRGFLSNQTVMRKYEDVMAGKVTTSPYDDFDLADSELVVKIGEVVCPQPKQIIAVDGEMVLSINQPERGSHFPSLSGIFTDGDGNVSLQIENNQWWPSSSSWDVETVGGVIRVFRGKNDIALELRVDPPTTIEVTKLNMRYGDAHFLLSDGFLCAGRLSNPDGDYILVKGKFWKPECVIAVDTSVPMIPVEETGVFMGMSPKTGVVPGSGGVSIAPGCQGAFITGFTFARVPKDVVNATLRGETQS